MLLSAAGAGDEGVVSMASARAVVKEEKQETRCAPAVRAKSEVAGRLALSKEAMSVVSMECGERRREAKKSDCGALVRFVWKSLIKDKWSFGL